MRFHSILILLILTACESESADPVEQLEIESSFYDRAGLISPAEAERLFEAEVLEPLRSWRFEPDPERYFALQLFDDHQSSIMIEVLDFKVGGLKGHVQPRESPHHPFKGEVTFATWFRLFDGLDNPAIPGHKHTHRYVLADGHWKLDRQAYSLGTVTADCLVGHLACDIWHVEALCVDEAKRLLDLQ